MFESAPISYLGMRILLLNLRLIDAVSSSAKEVDSKYIPGFLVLGHEAECPCNHS